MHICLVFMKIHWKRALVINTRDYIDTVDSIARYLVSEVAVLSTGNAGIVQIRSKYRNIFL
uniref:Uncharacterized protein n=1 Tax=Octopus bimaculoides TaxID=37653 RepID=A0A0L8FIQ0_OCTBM